MNFSSRVNAHHHCYQHVGGVVKRFFLFIFHKYNTQLVLLSARLKINLNWLSNSITSASIKMWSSQILWWKNQIQSGLKMSINQTQTLYSNQCKFALIRIKVRKLKPIKLIWSFSGQRIWPYYFMVQFVGSHS